MSKSDPLQLAANPATPPDALTALCENPTYEVGVALAGNPSTPTAAVLRLAESEWEEFRVAVAAHCRQPEALTVLSRHEWREVRTAVLCNPSTPPAVAFDLIREDNPRMSCELAELTGVPAPYLEELAESEHSEVRELVAQNLSTPPARLSLFAADGDETVRRAAAANPNTPATPSDPGLVARRLEASNPATPAETLTRRAADPEWVVRLKVAGHRSTPAAALESLVDDPEPLVRKALAHNPVASEVLLARLAKDADLNVRNAAAQSAKSPETLGLLGGDPEAMIRCSVALNPAAAPETLGGLAGDERQCVRSCVPRNPSTLPETLSALAEDRSDGVRRMVAENPLTPPETLARLAQDEDAAVRERVGLNPNVPVEAEIILAENRVDDPFAELPAEPQTPPPDYPRGPAFEYLKGMDAPAFSPLCRIDPGLETDPVALSLADLARRLSPNARVHITTSAAAGDLPVDAQLSAQSKLARLGVESPTAFQWVVRNEKAVDWNRVRTPEELMAAAAARFSERAKEENYVIRLAADSGAAQAEVNALRQMAANDPQAADALRRFEAAPAQRWGELLGHVNNQRVQNVREWRAYLTEGNEEYAKDPFWQDCAWDIVDGALTSDRNRGLGTTVHLNQGTLAELRQSING